MTRINVVPVTELCDKHLLAEYRELPRVFKLANHYERELPKQYVLGKGHVKFFYNKLGYLLLRQHEIIKELKQRGFKPKYDANDLQDLHTIHNDRCWGCYTPTQEALAINRARIAERMSQFKKKVVV